MTIWKRLLVALASMVVASIVAALLWRAGFDTRIPSYLSGVVGGLAALGTWELLRSWKRANGGVGAKNGETDDEH